MAVTTEILNGIKYIKMSGWEKAFLKKVDYYLNEVLIRIDIKSKRWRIVIN